MPIQADTVSIKSHKPKNGDIRRVSDWENPKFRYANIMEKSVEGLKVALSIEDRKGLTKSPPSEWGKFPKLKIKT